MQKFAKVTRFVVLYRYKHPKLFIRPTKRLAQTPFYLPSKALFTCQTQANILTKSTTKSAEYNSLTTLALVKP